jgi:hypothetical protein
VVVPIDGRITRQDGEIKTKERIEEDQVDLLTFNLLNPTNDIG